jgi:hypothetical protein
MDKMRWRYGDTNPVVAAVDSDTVIEIGDLLMQVTDDARPASTTDDPGLFQTVFLGVAMQRSRAGETAPIRVATTGVFEFDCPSGIFELGDMVGPYVQRGTTHLHNQSVDKTPHRWAVGRVAKRVSYANVSVLIAIQSTVMTGGVMAGGV